MATEIDRARYLASRFPRISPTPLPFGQLSGFEELGTPSTMRLFAPGPAALEAFRNAWRGDLLPTFRFELECGHALPADPPDTIVLRVACETCGTDVDLRFVEAA